MEKIKSGQEVLSFWSIISLLWYRKAYLLGSLILSIFISYYVISTTEPEFQALSIIEITSTGGGQQSLTRNVEAMNIPSLNILGIQPENSKNSITPKILGTEFLRIFAKQSSVAQKIEKECEYNFSKPSFFSFFGLLDYFNLYKVSPPSKEQEDNLQVNCLKSMIDIKVYEHKGTKTPAHEVTLKNEDPELASFLLNELIKFFFSEEEREKVEKHRIVMGFLSNEMARAKQEEISARKKHNDFLVQNPAFITTATRVNIPPPGRKSLILLDKISKFEEAIALLDTYHSLESNALISMLNKNIPNSSFSNRLIEILDSFKNDNKISSQNIEKVKVSILQEKDRIAGLVKVVNSQIQKLQKEAEEYLMLSKQEKELELMHLEKQLYVENIRSLISETAFNKGKDLFSSNIVHSRASPPIHPFTPKFKMVFLLSALACFSFASFFVFILQIKQRFVYSKEQVQNIFGPLPVTYLSSLTQLNIFWLNRLNKYRFKSASNLFQMIRDGGSRGLIIEIGNAQKREFSLAHLVLILSGTFFKNKGESVFLQNLGNEVITKNLFAKDFEPKLGREDEKSENGRNVNYLSKSFNERIELIDNFREKNYDRNLISLKGDEISPKELTELLSLCDFHLLVGKVGYFSLDQLSKYLLTENVDTDKCVGVVLVR